MEQKYDVVIEKVGSKKLSVISAIRTITDYSLQEAKDIVEGRSKVVMTGVSKEMAERAKTVLQKAGASINITSYEIFESKTTAQENVNTIEAEAVVAPTPAPETAVSEAPTKKSSVKTIDEQEAPSPKNDEQAPSKPKYQTADKDLVDIYKNHYTEITGCKIILRINQITGIITLVISGIIFVVTLLFHGLINTIIATFRSILGLLSGGDFFDIINPLLEAYSTIGDSLLDSLTIPIIILILYLIFITIPLGFIDNKILMSHIKKNGYDKHKTLEVLIDNVNRNNPHVQQVFKDYPYLENTSGKIEITIIKISGLIYLLLTFVPAIFSIIGHRLLHIPVDALIRFVFTILGQDISFLAGAGVMSSYRSLLGVIVSIVLVCVFGRITMIKSHIERKIYNKLLNKWL